MVHALYGLQYPPAVLFVNHRPVVLVLFHHGIPVHPHYQIFAAAFRLLYHIQVSHMKQIIYSVRIPCPVLFFHSLFPCHASGSLSLEIGCVFRLSSGGSSM